VERVNSIGTDSPLPIFSLDATLPLQHLQLNIFEPRYVGMVKRAIEGGGRRFGMVSFSPETREHAMYGVEVSIINASEQIDGRYHIELVGKRPFRIVDTARAPDGLITAKVEYFSFEDGDVDSSQAMELATDLLAAVEKWEKCVRRLGLERTPGQLNLIHEHLGTAPPHDQPGTLAGWVAALVNPIPSLGVAPEVRPSLLAAQTPIERLQVAREAVDASLANMQSWECSWLFRIWRLVPTKVRNLLPAMFVIAVAFVASHSMKGLPAT